MPSKMKVALIIAEEVELDLDVLWTVQKGLVQCNGLRGDSGLGIFNTLNVLKSRDFLCAERAQCIAVLLGWMLPIGADGRPCVTQALQIGIPVL